MTCGAHTPDGCMRQVWIGWPSSKTWDTAARRNLCCISAACTPMHAAHRQCIHSTCRRWLLRRDAKIVETQLLQSERCLCRLSRQANCLVLEAHLRLDAWHSPFRQG